jgi:acyl carrier protein
MNKIEQSLIQATVLQVLSNVLQKPLNQLAEDTNAKNTPNWDSLKHIEVMFAIEEEFSIQFSEAELSELNSVVKIVEAIKTHYAA